MDGRPKNRRQLKEYLKSEFGVRVPDRHVCGAGHASPFDYLWHAARGDQGDCIVWANRAGGKSFLAALASVIDQESCGDFHVRILGGSQDQSAMVYDHYTGLLRSRELDLVRGKILKTRTEFTNRSTVNILTQSEKNVRGQHVQRLRCDEIELFDRGVMAAAHFVTQSKAGHKAALEIFSTMHRPYGIMSEQVKRSQELGVPLYKWCLWEVIERCRGRSCSRCKLADDCQGKARRADGFLAIDDCLDYLRRSSRSSWESEMLCQRPTLDNVVFDTFAASVHVRPVQFDPNLPLYRAIDFGFVNPFVCLWIQVDRYGMVRVIDEYLRTRRLVATNIDAVIARYPTVEERIGGTFCDPAGAARNDVTGSSPISVLRSHGVRVRCRRSGIQEGIELIRRHLMSADKIVRLQIDPKCVRLIEALESYHYPEQGVNADESPLKDGVYDHPIDALRYFFVNYLSRGRSGTRPY